MSEYSEVLDDIRLPSEDLKTFTSPLSFQFKIGTLANDFTIKDATGKTLAYVRQKMFKLKEDIVIYSDESKNQEIYRIKADRIIDFNACYHFTNASGDPLGSVARKGMRSLWKASYQILDNDKQSEYTIKEENPWAKVMDALMCEIPLLGIFTGYMFHPKYGVVSSDGKTIARLKKEPSFWGRKFTLESLSDQGKALNERMMLAIMMMVLLERRRG